MAVRIQADVIVLNSQRLLVPGQVVVQHGHIVEVAERIEHTPDITCEGYALLPGLINPHTHLEFSEMCAPLPPGHDFSAWIASVLLWRQSAVGRQSKATAIAKGLAESAQAGVAVLADIVTPPWPISGSMTVESPELPDSGQLVKRFSEQQRHQLRGHLPEGSAWPKVIPCLEQLGLSEERCLQATQWRDQMLSNPQPAYGPRQLRWALAPHAPYSTPERLWKDCVALARQRGDLVAMHVAESPAERQWLDHGSGPMAELLHKFGIQQPPAASLVHDIINALAAAPRSLLIHGNYLNTKEIEHASQHAARLSVVYCPRTHAHFHHAEYPWHALRSRGLMVVLGTDSRSTNPDLNLWLEARQALQAHPTLRPSEALHAITGGPAKALGIDHRFGSLEVGRVARMNYLPLNGAANQDPDDLIHQWIEQYNHPYVLNVI